MNTLLGWFWRGCLLLVPIVVILYAGYVVVTTFDRLVPLGIPGLGFVVAVLLITFVGFMSSNVFGRAVVGYAEGALTKLPFVRLVYGSIRDLLQAFVGNRPGFDRPVAVSLLPGSARVLGFLTRDGLGAIGMPDHVAVYVPQSYNFAGNLVVVPRAQVEPLATSSTEVLALIVSGGVSGLGVDSPLSQPRPTRRGITETILGVGPRSRS